MQSVTLTNNGGLALDIANVALSPGFTLVANTCGATLAVQTACTLTVTFTPTAAGPVSGALTLTDNAPFVTQTVNLSGTGIDFTFAANGPTSMTVASGTSAVYSLLLSSVSTISGNVSFTCTGAPAHSTCTVAPSAAMLGSTMTLTATVETGLAHAALEPLQAPSPWLFKHGNILFALGIPLAFALRRRKRADWRGLLTFALVLTALASLSGCGSPRTIPDSGTGNGGTPTPTPSGTYNLTVSGTAAGIRHSVALTLIVQ